MDKLKVFIEKASAKHDNYYTYDSAIYVNNHTKLEISCPKHGKFMQTPGNHLSGSGCKACGYAKVSKKLSKEASEEFIENASKLHGSKYDYSKVRYNGNKNPVIITCTLHGDFNQSPNSHLNGRGCKTCGYIKLSENSTNTTEEFITKAQKIHGSRYDYNNTNYTTSRAKVEIMCKIHGKFRQVPAKHLSGQGCSLCGAGTDGDLLYIWRVNNSDTYKIGITSARLGDRRIKEVASSFTALATECITPSIVCMINTVNAKEIESKLLQKFNTAPSNIPNSISGYTEFRTLTNAELAEALEIINKDSLVCTIP